ncbi:hypothetical protein H6P81_009627 [Aristolochia fimbriata]|uniref:Uncharacterized protein n=1 Tax=Aristolochia fimbriata TaxID=158543 RepID=A0AAV7ELG4_ARIFI|nr:hypothetical protein H6P81_009627 [Aristolochia fimbriata]
MLVASSGWTGYGIPDKRVSRTITKQYAKVCEVLNGKALPTRKSSEETSEGRSQPFIYSEKRQKDVASARDCEHFVRPCKVKSSLLRSVTWDIWTDDTLVKNSETTKSRSSGREQSFLTDPKK